MTATTDAGYDPQAGAFGWPILVAQAGRHGNREVMLPARLGRELTRSVLGGLMSADEEPTATKQATKQVPVTAADGTAYTLVSRRVRATSDGAARVWDLRSRRPPGVLAGHTGLVSGVSLSGDGRIAATAGWDFTLRTWETGTGAQLALVTDPDRRFSGCCLTADGETLAATGFDGTVGVYDPRTGEPRARVRVPVNLPGAIAVDAGATVVFAGGQDGTVRRVRPERDELDPLDGHEGPVTALALSPDGRLLASAGRDGVVVVWDVERAAPVARLLGHHHGATTCAFLDATRVLTSGWDGAVHLWDLPNRTTEPVWQDESAIRALAVVSGVVVVVSSQDGVITALDPTGATAPVRLAAADGHVDTVASAAHAPVLITGSTNDVLGGVPVRDGFGRPATFTEGLLVPGAGLDGELPPSIWDRVHAEALTALGIVSADPSGRTIVGAPRIALG
ncbi:WD40 repeat domain-containing protein [Dactylosporangium sp. NPDC005572]|uniref:WD40 repeat domain-containing protein n=1 Tax=Dactylosporangium sp. NPDC005572 TaxID=3156889 RepID=UPI0033BB6E33